MLYVGRNQGKPKEEGGGGGGKEKKKKSANKIIKKSDGRFLPKGKSLEREKGSIPPPSHRAHTGYVFLFKLSSREKPPVKNLNPRYPPGYQACKPQDGTYRLRSSLLIPPDRPLLISAPAPLRVLRRDQKQAHEMG